MCRAVGKERGERVGVARRSEGVCNDFCAWILWGGIGAGPLTFTFWLDGRADGAFLAFTLLAAQMHLADFLAVALVADLAGLVVGVLLAEAVFADEVWCAAVGGVTEVAFASECAVALLGDIGI